MWLFACIHVCARARVCVLMCNVFIRVCMYDWACVCDACAYVHMWAVPSTLTGQDHDHTPLLQRPRHGSGVSESSALANVSGGSESAVHFRSTKEQLDFKSSKKQKRPQDCAVVVAWLENLNDMAHFPHRQLTHSLHGLMFPPPVPSSATPQLFDPKKHYQGQPFLPTIFIYPLPSGLYRIHTWVPAVR